jgi:putative transcriptional regulator
MKSPPERQRNVSNATTTAKRRDGRTAKSDRNGERDEYGMTAADWAQLRAMSESEVLAAARRDPDALPLEDRRPESLGPAGRVAFSKRIRWQLGLSQTEFAELFRIPARTLRDWEQHRREPDQAARAYLEVIARSPEAVIDALKASPRRER